MKKKVSYSIAEPCHEDWNAMIPEEKGRFCKSCEKTVIDFTGMSLPAIHRYMEQAKTSVCGRMTPQQVHAPVYNKTVADAYRFSLQALVLGTAISTFTAFNAYSQGQVVKAVKGKVAPTETIRGEVAAVCRTPPKKDSVFSGKVIDYMNDTYLSGVSVTLYDENDNELATTLSNAAGEFLVPLAENWEPYKAVFRKEDLPETVFYFEGVTSTIGTVIEMTKEAEFTMGIMIRTDD